MKVHEVMNTEVVTAQPDSRVCDIIELFHLKNITGVPVVEDGRVVGVISKKDILPLVASFDVDYETLERLKETCTYKVADYMQREVINVPPVEPVESCAMIMINNNINRLPVMEDGALVGIVTRGDILKALASCGGCEL
ncbi:MAG: CBS domain-containing protein [Deltaproteobacteria bacterium]|nr:CBS domain-containing protein [Candidatus Anaeroferrophillus wilburensis]MBN2888778.1 CBS domain-containing protein [Deltaproteobacteria bacterium]